MKKLLVFLPVFIFFTAARSQSSSATNPFPKTITVTGSAEMLVIPDEIYVDITLREYQKRNQAKRELETIKTEFLSACTAAGLADSSISVQSYTGYSNYYWLRKKKKGDQDLLAGITYQVKFSSVKEMDQLIEKLDDEATVSFDIAYTRHSKMTEFRRQLKIQAVKAAKEKGIYLTEAIGENLGAAITVKEPEEPEMAGMENNYLISQANISYSKPPLDKSVEVAFKKLRIRYEVEVIFAIL
ncbi:MAG: SIMPL domain-containing protein [Sphingobacteriales bacterium]|nr:SIMPL domain-containing protein [Sphingobacteriales bacterium]